MTAVPGVVEWGAFAIARCHAGWRPAWSLLLRLRLGGYLDSGSGPGQDPESRPRVATPARNGCGRNSLRVAAANEGPALTYFRVATIIGPGCLTAVFGMGTGMTSQVWAPGGASRPTPRCGGWPRSRFGNKKSRMRESERAGEAKPRVNRISRGREGQANRLVSTGE